MTRILRIYTDLLLTLLVVLAGSTARAQQTISLGKLPNGQEVRFVNEKGFYNLYIGQTASYPVAINQWSKTRYSLPADPSGYQKLRRLKQGVIATHRTDFYSTGSGIEVVDTWSLAGNELRLDRMLRVLATVPKAFFSSDILLNPFVNRLPRHQYEMFVPGMVYGTSDNLPPTAIGRATDSVAFQTTREDRMPIPMVALRMPSGQSVVLLNCKPDGRTVRADAENFVVRDGKLTTKEPVTIIDSRVRVGSLGYINPTTANNEDDLDRPQFRYQFPGSEYPTTYKGNTYPDVGVEAGRPVSHPYKKGLTQTYSLIFRFTQTPDFPTLMRESWRWAWDKLKPAVNHHDIRTAEQSLVAQLSSQVETHGVAGKPLTGITNWRPAVPNDSAKDPKTVMGFTGKALETAEFLLWAANQPWTGDSAATYRRKGEALFASFVRTVKLDPPTGEGFDMQTGRIALAIPKDKQVYLRSFTDDLKATLRAYRREKQAGRNHEDWLAWAKSFGDWLLNQQRSDGGIPRAWKPGTGEVADASATSSYNAVPMLLLLGELTGDDRYRQAAARAGEYAWSQSGQRFGRFTGGTIDNPDVLDKEAGTLSLEAYLALYEQTKATVWLDRARAAADFAETWLYLWNVPMPADADDRDLHWKRGVPTAGLQLISTGHSLADAYMAFDADEYAKLYRYTNDRHYYDVAKLLLHNTLNMTALPGRTYDLRGPGWQQEHWSLAPWRGHGFHRGWLPWVSTSHLNGMIGLEEFDQALYKDLCQ